MRGQPAAGQDLQITAGFEASSSVGRYDELALTLNRPLTPDEGALAVFLGTTDMTALFVLDGTVLRYQPELAPLPPGARDLIVYQVVEAQPWRQLERFPLRVRLRGDFEQAAFEPTLTVNNKGQLAEGTFPSPEEDVDRRLYQDFSGQFDAQGEVAHGPWTLAAEAQVVGVSYQQEALRFGDLEDAAPRVDLAGYRLRAARGPLALQAGHVAHGRHRHLIQAFDSRGLTAGVQYGDRADLSVAVLNGTRLVGWRNPLGVHEPDHRIVSGAVGFEVLPRRPGALRLEGAYLDGSVLPRTGFNAEAVPDAERSRGVGARLQAATPGRRLRIEAGYAGSRYTNPLDPALAQDDVLVPVQAETRFAHYVEAVAGILQGVPVTPRLPLDVEASYRRERIDPLYGTVATYVRADNLLNTFELQSRLGPVSLQLAHTRSEDNLDEVSSILKTRTRQHGANLGVPLRSLAGQAERPWFVVLPVLSYSYNRTHQYGVGLPVDGGFSEGHVPDQLNHVHNASLSWQGRRWNLGYRFGASFQDNRQEGRAEADFANHTHSLALALNLSRRFDLGLDGSLDQAESRAQERIDRTRRLGVRATLRPADGLTFSAMAAPTRTEDDAETSSRTSTSLSFEGAYAFNLSGGARPPVRGQVFIRYARQASHYRDTAFEIDSRNRTWAVNSGVTLTLF